MLCSHILTGERQRGVIKRVHADVNKTLDIAGGSVARHDVGTEEIDRRLNDDVAQRKQRSLQSGGKTDPGDFPKDFPIGFQRFQGDMTIILFADQREENQNGTDDLRDDGGVGDAVGRHAESEHEQEIRTDIEYAGDRKINQRSLGIASGPKQGASEIVKQIERHADEVNPDISGR